MQNLIDGLTIKDLPNEDLEFLAEIIGIEAVKILLTRCPGMSFYVPLKLGKKFRKKYIVENYNAGDCNARTVARELGVTQKTVWKLLGEKYTAN